MTAGGLMNELAKHHPQTQVLIGDRDKFCRSDIKIDTVIRKKMWFR